VRVISQGEDLGNGLVSQHATTYVAVAAEELPPEIRGSTHALPPEQSPTLKSSGADAERVVLRGLQQSCISACTLYEWYDGMRGSLDPEEQSFGRAQLDAAIRAMKTAGLVEVQRTVRCSVHKCPEAPGLALTEAGYQLANEIGW
jgi:hypothetical protein